MMDRYKFVLITENMEGPYRNAETFQSISSGDELSTIKNSFLKLSQMFDDNLFEKAFS